MAKTRILIADDHGVLRAGLRLMIQTQRDLEVIGEAGSHAEALSLTQQLRPDILTLDWSMPQGQGHAVIQHIAEACPQTRVIVLTMHEEPAVFRAAMAAGAAGYVVKSAADSELLDAIRTVAAGRVYTRVDLHGAPAAIRSLTPRTHQPLESLSEREREVLILVAQGHTNQAIADRLGLSVKTIESYRARLMGKLRLRSRAELTQFAVEAGLLTPGLPE